MYPYFCKLYSIIRVDCIRSYIQLYQLSTSKGKQTQIQTQIPNKA